MLKVNKGVKELLFPMVNNADDDDENDYYSGIIIIIVNYHYSYYGSIWSQYFLDKLLVGNGNINVWHHRKTEEKTITKVNNGSRVNQVSTTIIYDQH